MQISKCILNLYRKSAQIYYLANVNKLPKSKTMSSTFSSNGANGSVSCLQQILSEFPKPEVVKIRDHANVEKLLAKIVQDGAKSLQVIADFDQTITRYHLNGEPCDSLHGILGRSPELSQDVRDKIWKLFDKYYPIEISPELTEDEKLPHIIEWYELSHELITSTGIDKEFIRQLVLKSKCFLRDNAAELFNTLNENKVPVLIFSAGLGDLLEVVLEKYHIKYPNMKIVSNYMEFDPVSGKICGFKQPLIHTLNKNESALFENDNYFLDLAHHGNAVLLGDNIGDSHMSAGMTNPGTILKIGYLNDRIESRLETFMNTFDIVLCDDQTMDLTNLIVKNVLKK